MHTLISRACQEMEALLTALLCALVTLPQAQCTVQRGAMLRLEPVSASFISPFIYFERNKLTNAINSMQFDSAELE